MEDDVAGAISLFESADSIVKDSQGVIAFALREAIAKDIAALRLVPDTDVDGIFVALGALEDQIPKLQQKDLGFTPKPMSDAPETGETPDLLTTNFAL